MTFPRHYPQTYGTRAGSTTTKIIESLSSVVVSTPRVVEKFCEGIIQIVSFISGKTISKQTIVVANCIVIRSSNVIRLVSATLSATPTWISKVAKSVSNLCNTLSEFVGIRLYSKLVSATSSYIGVVGRVTTRIKHITGVADSSVFQVLRGISKRTESVSDTFSSIQRMISKTSFGNLISVGTVSRISGRFIQSTTDILGTVSKTVTKVTITKAVAGYVGTVGTIIKTTTVGFVKKMFTYPADPEFKVEEDESTTTT